MWRSMEEVLRELKEEGILENNYNNNVKSENSECGLPPGFRFHPTDEELITFYLASKVFDTTTTTSSFGSFNPTTTTTNLFFSNSSSAQIAEVDLTRCEPWDLPERARMGEKEWYLYSLRDRKYPSGLRTNRATETGYWKATGKDRQVFASGVAASGGGAGGVLIGMKKTLVFYQGRAPRGTKTKWVMHEYRLDGHFSSFRLSSKEEWVICRIFKKKNAGDQKKLSSSSLTMHPPPPPPPPLSPFLGSLPPLQELTTTATAATAACSATQALANTSSRPPYYANHDSNSLLHSLLLNPLPNFSSISGSDTIFPSLTTTTTAADIIRPPLSTTTAVAAATKQLQQQQQQQQCWLDRICPQINQLQYYQQQQCHHDCFDDMMLMMDSHHHHHLPNTGDNHDDDQDVKTGAIVDHDMCSSSSYASAAVSELDRMLNYQIMTVNQHNNVAESTTWSFHHHHS